MSFTSLCSEPEKGVHPAPSFLLGLHLLGTLKGELLLKGDPNRTVTPSFPEQERKRGLSYSQYH